ncbi:hypothetical protein BJX70DRAFT_183957 [Aspergillus crustosus]
MGGRRRCAGFMRLSLFSVAHSKDGLESDFESRGPSKWHSHASRQPSCSLFSVTPIFYNVLGRSGLNGKSFFDSSWWLNRREKSQVNMLLMPLSSAYYDSLTHKDATWSIRMP